MCSWIDDTENIHISLESKFHVKIKTQNYWKLIQSDKVQFFCIWNEVILCDTKLMTQSNKLFTIHI